MEEVIVIGANYATALGVIRSLGEAGYGVKLIGRHKETVDIAGKSKYVDQAVTVFDNEYPTLFNAMEELRGHEERMLVIPTNDGICQILDEHVAQLSRHYILPNIHNEDFGLTRFMDKMVQKELAIRCGLPVAKGKWYDTRRPITETETDIVFPCFVKPLASANVVGCKTLFAVCNNMNEVNSAIEAAKNRDCEKVLIERYLQIDEELCVYGVAAHGKVYAPACVATTRGGVAQHKGVTAEGKVIPASRLGSFTDKIIEFVKRSGLTGMFCVDILRSGNELYFSEINLRFGGSGYAVTLAGANLPAALADMEYGKPINRPMEVQKEIIFLNERIEFDAYIGGHITETEYKAHMSGNQERFIRDQDDIKPWNGFKKMTSVRILKRKTKGILGINNYHKQM